MDFQDKLPMSFDDKASHIGANNLDVFWCISVYRQDNHRYDKFLNIYVNHMVMVSGKNAHMKLLFHNNELIRVLHALHNKDG